MRRIGPTVIVVAAVAMVAAGCASPPQQRDDVCGEVVEKVGALPGIGGSDSTEQIVPLLDSQLGIAREARAELGGITPDDAGRQAHDVLLARWDDTIREMQELRETWKDPSGGRPRYPGDDLVLALTIGAAATGLQRAADGLAAAAGPAGAPSCGTIPWRGGD